MFVSLSDRVGIIPGGVNIGVLRADSDRLILVDTGLNESSAKRVLKVIRELNFGQVVAILTTHAHADHFGGNRTVVKRTSAKVYASAWDEAVLRYPLLLPVALYGGADPLDTLRGSFFLADASPVDVIVEPGSIEIHGLQIEVVSLSGHSLNQVGYLVDGVFFCADVVLPEQALAKYKIPYLYSVTHHLAALETASAVNCDHVVPGHGETLNDIQPLVEVNRDLLMAVMAEVKEVCRDWVSVDAVMTHVLTKFDAPVTDAASFYLLQPTIYAMMTHMHRTSDVRHEVREGKSLWRAT
ncbi:MAG: MBL fold metallo-hydrolase [Chloroflexota bacterium]|nr:MBL fold metallo-hydrolase [Chloroflexota bacterium]